MTLATLIVYLDKRLIKDDPVLGEEWDFTKNNTGRKT